MCVCMFAIHGHNPAPIHLKLNTLTHNHIELVNGRVCLPTPPLNVPKEPKTHLKRSANYATEGTRRAFHQLAPWPWCSGLGCMLAVLPVVTGLIRATDQFFLMNFSFIYVFTVRSLSLPYPCISPKNNGTYKEKGGGFCPSNAGSPASWW